MLIFLRTKSDETEHTVIGALSWSRCEGTRCSGHSGGPGFREERGGHPGTWQEGRGCGAGTAGQANVGWHGRSSS